MIAMSVSNKTEQKDEYYFVRLLGFIGDGQLFSG